MGCISVGETVHHADHALTLVSVDGRASTMRIDDTELELTMARRDVPTPFNGLQVFLAVTRPVADQTSDHAFPLTHAFLTADAVLGVADAAQPSLDPARYTFPIDRADGFNWTMEEDSHMFAYLTPERAHEGIDIDLTGGKRTGRHKLVAIENGIVRRVSPGPEPQVCLIIESDSLPGIHYLYQHVDRENVFVAAGDHVTRGQPLGHIWGDARWAHLHFTVIASGTTPEYSAGYQYMLSTFPQLFELWQGSLAVAPSAPRTQGEFIFADPYYEQGNRQHLGAYAEPFGYGWRFGAGEPTAKVPASLQTTDPLQGRSALLNHGLHMDNPSHSNDSRDTYTFEVAVAPGEYRVHVCVGHCHTPTAQCVLVEGIVAGDWYLKAGEWVDAPPLTVRVNDEHLTDPHRPASLKVLRFERLGD